MGSAFRWARVVVAALATVTHALPAQERDENDIVHPDLLSTLEYRSVGPFRGGRVTAVGGFGDRPGSFVMGTTGGGVWVTDDAGERWRNVTDDALDVGSIGAVEVAPGDPNVIYVGTGSAGIRGNVSIGRGVWRSTDRGDTWTFSGLPDAGLIGKIQVDPRDADVAFVAALGNPFAKNPERGVYRTRDGGESWDRVLFVADSVGAVDLVMDPSNPRVLYAGMWRAQRKPWTLVDASRDGGVWKTTDGGDHWTRLTDPSMDNGLPSRTLFGRIGLAVSPANPDRVWALINAPDPHGGIWRSDDGGDQWEKVNRDRRFRQRHWYYSHLEADPRDPNTIYVLNTGMYRSVDGGEDWERIQVPHGDVHDLWIQPGDPDAMVVGNDGGAQVSLNGGRSWSTMHNQPTAEFYRVEVDHQWPYRLYGAQQDNSTISVSSRVDGDLSPEQDWYSVGGAESGHISVHPHPDSAHIVWAGNYIGQVDRVNLKTGERRNMILYPEMGDGVAPRDARYRFQWNAPILISRHDPGVVYHASQYVHRTTDGGMTWETISPDLTTDNEEQQGLPGGPLQVDHTGVEVYNTVFVLSESPDDPEELWAGTDDGRVHLTRDGGATWTEITPDDMPREGTVNSIDLSTRRPGRAVMAVYRYRDGDFRPYVFLTDDYGDDWDLLTDGENGIPEDHPVRVVREDPDRPGLFYAGTEFGMYLSFDEGDHWQPLQLNLPRTPVTDLRVHRQDLVVATQGRSFWILDDLTPLHGLRDEVTEEALHLVPPRDVTLARFRATGGDRAPDDAANGVVLHFWIGSQVEGEVEIEVLDADGTVIR
ncbi:MAG: glycosyl hydrolase, partial [Gemmatimonadota bacterium]